MTLAHVHILKDHKLSALQHRICSTFAVILHVWRPSAPSESCECPKTWWQVSTIVIQLQEKRHLITKDVRKIMPPCFNIDSKHYIEMKQTKYISERVLLVFAVVNSLENTWSKNSQGRFKGLLHAKQHIKQILTYGFIVLDWIESNSVMLYAVLHTTRNGDHDDGDNITGECPALALGDYTIVTIKEPALPIKNRYQA